MWARIGVRARLRTLPLVTYFPMLQRYEASIFMLGWGVPTFDALYSLQSLVRSVGAQGDGNYNVGRYSNPQVDALIERMKKETDPKTRAALVDQALTLVKREVSHIPLHHQVIPWAMRRTVEMRHRADNRIDMPAVKVN
jgi:peptide/nickel transport system substrate-binding protein